MKLQTTGGSDETLPKATAVEITDCSSGNTVISVEFNGYSGNQDIVDDNGRSKFGYPSADSEKWFGGRRIRKMIVAAQRNDVLKLRWLLNQTDPFYKFWHPKLNINGKDAFGMTPFLHACFAGSFDVIQVLLREPSIDIHVCDYFGRNVLHLLASGSSDLQRRAGLIEHLITLGVTAKQKDQRGKTPEHYAKVQTELTRVMTVTKLVNAMRTKGNEWGPVPLPTPQNDSRKHNIKKEGSDSLCGNLQNESEYASHQL